MTFTPDDVFPSASCSCSRWKVVYLKRSKVLLCMAVVIFINTQSEHLIVTEDKTPSSQTPERNDTPKLGMFICIGGARLCPGLALGPRL